MANMQICVDTYADRSFQQARDRVAVLELGSADVNGSYRTLFGSTEVVYTGVDLAAGPGVDVVLPDAYRLPFPDGSMDLVLSGQMLEHCEFFWLAFREMMRVLRPDGFLFLIAPSAGPIHQFPVDCYRFYPDGFRALAKDVGACVVDLWMDDKGPWNDLVGVFSHEAHPARPRVIGSMDPDVIASVRPPSSPGPPDAEQVSQGTGYLELLGRLHSRLRPDLYLEIGVREGGSLALARGPALGIDPSPRLTHDLPTTTTVVSETSDAFFASGPEALKSGIDLAFIDGMHWAEFALRDFINVERHSQPWSLIVFDDVFPLHPAQAERQRRTQVWTGDVWRAVESLRRHRPDLLLVPLSTGPTGLMLVAGLKPGHRALLDSFNPVMSELNRERGIPPPPGILQREGALSPDDERVGRLLDILASLRVARASAGEVEKALSDWRTTPGPDGR